MRNRSEGRPTATNDLRSRHSRHGADAGVYSQPPECETTNSARNWLFWQAGVAMIQEPSETKAPLASRVRDYMTSEPQCLGVRQTLLDAVLMIRMAPLRHIPILEDGRLVGILSDRDVHRLAPSLLIPLSPQEYNRVFADTPLEKVMIRNPLTIHPDAPLADAVNLLVTERLGCLPVLDEGKLVGIITVSDMLKALYDLVSLSSSKTPHAPTHGLK